MNKILTITVPSYNVEGTIKDTVQSLLVPEVMDDIEILIVNDGSSDSTAEIGKELEKQYPESIKLINKKNGGHGSTINTGIRIASGTYFKVVDGDDWLDKEGLIQLIKTLKNTEADIIYNPFVTVNDKNGEEKLQNPAPGFKNNSIYNFDTACRNIDIPMHSMTIKTELLRNIFIDEHCFYVDVEYVLLPIIKVQTIQFLDSVLYRYRIFSDTQSVSPKNMQKNVLHHLKVTKRMIEFYEKEKEHLSDSRRTYIRNRILQLIEMQYGIYYSFPYNHEIPKTIAEFSNYISHNSPELYSLSNGTTVRLMRLAPNLFYPFIKLRESFRK